ncbi:MAG: homoserine kinase [Ilumatobacteraceae bacterium]|nr:homoserine kinase [Ilumatobacteraceae bacterium]
MVADAFVAALRRHQPLARLVAPPQPITTATSTWVWFVDLTGVNLPVAWQGPLVLRIFRPGEASIAEREDRLSTFLTANGYPAPATHLRGELGGTPHPFVMQQRLPGVPANELITTVHIRGVVTGLGRLQGQLHNMSTTNFPLRRLTAAVYLEHELAPRRASVSAIDPDDWLTWLRSTAADHEASRDTDIVVCHGDFHPLNAVADTTDGLTMGIVDWTDACLADRHLDLGRSVAVYSFASVISSSPSGRRALHAVRRWMARRHLKAYRSVTGVTLDDQRLTWWQIAHLYRGWLQLSALIEGAGVGPPSTTNDRFPPQLRDDMLARCRVLRERLNR